MKIGKLTETERIDLLQPARAAGGERREQVAQARAADRVSVSGASRRLMAEAAAAETDPIRRQKVEEIRQALREGRFEVNAWAVADRMISEAAELLEVLSRPK